MEQNSTCPCDLINPDPSADCLHAHVICSTRTRVPIVSSGFYIRLIYSFDQFISKSAPHLSVMSSANIEYTSDVVMHDEDQVEVAPPRRPGYVEQNVEGRSFIVPSAFGQTENLALARMVRPNWSPALEMPGGVSISLHLELSSLIDEFLFCLAPFFF